MLAPIHFAETLRLPRASLSFSEIGFLAVAYASLPTFSSRTATRWPVRR